MAEVLRQVNVTAPKFDDAHGVLSLDGPDSTVTLTGNLPIAGESVPGWFDLRLGCPDGREVLIHNAVRTSMSFPSGSSVRSATYFPNMVVDNASSVGAEGMVRSVTFALEGWHKCFAYNYVETLDVFGNPPESLRAALEASRFEFYRDEMFAPEQVFVVNDLGTIIDFDVGGRRYSIFAGQQNRVGRRQLNVEFRLLGTIQFPEPVDLETATDACWDWRRYFNQMAMSELSFTGMAVASELDPTAPCGNLYLPYEESVERPRQREPVAARHMPLNQWNERDAARDAMRKWLGQQGDRRVFRSALDRVLSRPGHVSTEDAVALCAGIDTLQALRSRESLPVGALDAMTSATIAAAKKFNAAIEEDRVRSLLGSLQNDDLRRRLWRLVQIAAPETDQTEVEHLIANLLPLRLFGAHGRLPAQNNELLAGPTVEALAALCARYDLQDAGVPDHSSSGGRSHPRLQWDEALFALKMLEENGNGDTQ